MEFSLCPTLRDVLDAARRFLAAHPHPTAAELHRLGWFDAEIAVLGRVLLAKECGAAGVWQPWDKEPLAAAGEALGIAGLTYRLAAEHACRRNQFGHPIGTHQAVAFPIVDGYLRVELARSALLRAAAETDPYSSPVLVAAAVLQARNAAVRNCELAIQTFGASGLTAQGPLSAPYQRALALSAGPPTTTTLRADLVAALSDRSLLR